MKRGFLLIMVWLCTIGMQAQSEFSFILNKEGKIIAIPKSKNYELNLPKFFYKSYTPASTRDIDIKLRQFVPNLTPSIDERPMDMQVLSEAYRPFFNVFTPMIREVSPMALDFNETYVKQLSDNFDFLANGTQYTWPGAGGLTTMNTAVSWHSGNWRVYGGAFGGRFFTPFNPSPQLVGGFNSQVEFEATDWLKVKGWGQYAFYGKESNNPHMLYNPFYNHTQVGGALEFKITEDFGVGMGVNFEYNPIKRKMEPQYLVYPVIRNGRFKLGW